MVLCTTIDHAVKRMFCLVYLLRSDLRCLDSALRTVHNRKRPEWLSTEISCHQCPHHGKRRDPLFSFVEEQHVLWLSLNITQGEAQSETEIVSADESKGRSWGKILDAGTGSYSFKWLRWYSSEMVVGITASKEMQQIVQKQALGYIRAEDQIIVGNWNDENSLKEINGTKFDVVLADYLIGAMEAFSPFAQESFFEKVKPYVKSRIYVTGMEPYGVPNDFNEQGTYSKREDRGGEQLSSEIAMNIMRLRDVIIMLTGERYYREYPVEWVVDTMRRAGFVVDEVRLFPINWGKKSPTGPTGPV